MALTKEQWREVEERLSCAYGRAHLICDGRRISACNVPVKKMKLGIAVYIDGVIEWKHAGRECPDEIKKFWHTRKVWVFPPTERAKLKKDATKRGTSRETRESLLRFAERHFFMWDPIFPCASTFLRQIRKTCSSIELEKLSFELDIHDVQ